MPLPHSGGGREETRGSRTAGTPSLSSTKRLVLAGPAYLPVIVVMFFFVLIGLNKTHYIMGFDIVIR